MKPISVIVISDEALPRSGLKHLLASELKIEVAGEAEPSLSLDLVRSAKPDVAIIHAPFNHSGLVQLVAKLHAEAPRTAIVIAGRDTHPATVRLIFASGAAAYVLIKSTPRELFNAIRSAARGRKYLDPNLSEQLIVGLATDLSSQQVLSGREQQVLHLLAYGHTLTEIAAQLGIGRKSAETYLARIRQKLKLRTRAEIVKYAVATGLFTGKVKSKS